MTKKREPFYPQDERPADATGTLPDGTTWEVRELSIDEAAASMGKSEAELAELLEGIEAGTVETVPLEEFMAALRRKRAH